MRTSGFEVLDIRISRAREAGYDVEVRLGEREFPAGRLAAEVVAEVTTASPEDQGAGLFAGFVADERVRAAWTVAAALAPRRRIRLRIDDDAPELQALPWEALRDATPEATAREPAADRDTPFSRLAVSSRGAAGPLVERPLHVLTAVAAPTGLAAYKLPALDRSEEEREIAAAMASAPAGLVRHTALAGRCTLAALEAALEHGVHVLHLLAHGVTRADGEVSLMLEGADGAVDRVEAGRFAAMCERLERSLRLVVLMACNSARRSPSDPSAGLSPKLLAAGVPALLAMQDLMPVRTARAFTRTFYEQLWRGGEVDVAANRARATVQTGRYPGTAVPVLYSDAGGPMFDPAARASAASRRFGEWTALGGSARQIAAVRGGDGRVEVFAVDAAGRATSCRQARADGAFSGWEPVRDGVREVQAVVDLRGRVALFVIDGEGAVLQRVRAGARWTEWVSLGGKATRMAATLGVEGALAVFMVDDEERMQFAEQVAEDGAWDGWYDGWELADEQHRQFAAVRDGRGLIKVFTLHDSGELWSGQQDEEGEFAEEVRLGEQVQSFAVGLHGGRVQAIAVAADGAARRCEQKTPGGAWGGWQALGGQCSEVAVGGGEAGLEVFGLAADGRLASAREVDGAWSWAPIAGPRLAQLVVVDEGATLVGLGRDGQVYCCSLVGSR